MYSLFLNPLFYSLSPSAPLRRASVIRFRILRFFAVDPGVKRNTRRERTQRRYGGKDIYLVVNSFSVITVYIVLTVVVDAGEGDPSLSLSRDFRFFFFLFFFPPGHWYTRRVSSAKEEKRSRRCGKRGGFVDPRQRAEKSRWRARRVLAHSPVAPRGGVVSLGSLCPTRWIVTRVRIPAEAARGPPLRAELCRWSNK